MDMWQQVKQWLTGRTPAQRAGQEADVQHDTAQPDPAASDGTVGRASADDGGYTGETGAERRATGTR